MDLHAKIIAYYISDYGFGHATRSLAVIRSLCGQKGIRIIICHAFAYDFINQSLAKWIGTGKVKMRKISNDFGYVLHPHSLAPDRDQLTIKCRRFINELPSVVQREAEFLEDQQVNLVIGDIPPAPFKAARILSIPSIGLSNFTWFTAYRDLLSDADLCHFYNCYKDIDYFFALAGSNEPEWGRKGNKTFDFFSRSPHMEAVHKIRKSINPSGAQTIVFFGLGMKIDAGNLSAYKLWSSPNCVFLVSHNMNIEGENIHKIPADETESQNYIAASDVVISKPGWGTIAEAVSCHKPLILVTRDDMQEDKNTIHYLQNNGGCSLVEWEELREFEVTSDLKRKLEKQQRRPVRDSEEVLNDLVGEIKAILFE
ncbi:MAG: hypothetical protein K0Q56_2461 [Sporolactobacillus laevolacticus]|jgi:UDP-N-acetylglucosamine transferase subunit ALG13|nr:hypothetical protein [Sporolactobacillus laevolacticus]